MVIENGWAYFTVNEVARLCALHPNTVYWNIKTGKLAATRNGRRILVSESALEDWRPGVAAKCMKVDADGRIWWQVNGENVPGHVGRATYAGHGFIRLLAGVQ